MATNPLWERQQQDVEFVKRLQKQPGDRDRVLVVSVPFYQGEPALREQQCQFYVDSHSNIDVFFVQATSPQSIVDAAQNHVPLDDMFVLAHGDPEGNYCFPDGTKASPHTIYAAVTLRNGAAGFSRSTLASCYNHKAEQTMNEKLMDHQLKRLTKYTTSSASKVAEITYNLESPDGRWVHTALNPEVLEIEHYQMKVQEIWVEEKNKKLQKHKK